MLEDAEAWMGEQFVAGIARFFEMFDIMIPHLFPFVKWGRKTNPFRQSRKGK